MLNLDRASGVFMPLFSLPSSQGIGCLGRETEYFCQKIADYGMSYWQICPLGPTGYGDSPYQTFSAFALSNYYIDLSYFLENNWCKDNDITSLKSLPTNHVDYLALYNNFWPIIKLAFENFINSKNLSLLDDFNKFKKAENYWLETYCMFMAIKAKFNGKSWLEWPEKFKNFENINSENLPKELLKEIEANAFAQWVLDKQWRNLKSKANNIGLKIIGDIPLYVGLDSAEVWANKEVFAWDFKKNLPAAVAGVPPDYFSQNGQLWGNPVFNWEYLSKTNYNWWLTRLKRNLDLFDVVRLDHFRGFYDYWSVKYDSHAAKDGSWLQGPKTKLFDEIKKAFPTMPFILEDLGDLHSGVIEFKEQLNLPGMAILQFAFDSTPQNAYLPHNLNQNTVLYTGTHDNNTSVGWYNEANESVKDFCRRYLRVNGETISWDLIRVAYASVANLVIIPMQDFLSLDSSARINTPGKICNNWSWRLTTEALNKFSAQSQSYLQELTAIYSRKDS